MTEKELIESRRLADKARAITARQDGGEPIGPSLALVRQIADSYPKLLAHADALAAEVAALQMVADDAAADGPSAAALRQAQAEEREGCRLASCWWCADGLPYDAATGMHAAPDGGNVLCDAVRVRARGPCRPPLPFGGLRAENERLKGLLRPLASAAIRVVAGSSEGNPRPATAANWRALDKAACAAQTFVLLEGNPGE